MLRPLAQIASLQALLAGVFLGIAAWSRLHPAASAPLDRLTQDGASGLAAAALILSAFGALACLHMAWARDRTLHARADAARRAPASRAAGWPQGVLALLFAAACIAVLWRLPPRHAGAPVLAAQTWFIIAGVLLLPAFLAMLGRRVAAALPVGSVPEAAALDALLRLPAATFLALSAVAAASGFGFGAAHWLLTALAAYLLAVAGELAVRTLRIWFLPLPAPEGARAAVGSLLAGLLEPGALAPPALAQRLKSQVGLDITRSWAIAYVRDAAAPVLLFLLLLCWVLTGATRIGLTERGIYEVFGAPVAVLHPGLHLVAPWPVGRVQRIEYGVLHAVNVASTVRTGKADTSTADGPPPDAANQLWTDRPDQNTSFLIASDAGGRQSFEAISIGLRVLYQVGLDDASARRTLDGAVAPAALVRALTGRLLAYEFASRTLPEALGANRLRLAAELQRKLQAALDRVHGGLQVVALVIESMHPPAGAAAAYRSVQAAQIAATTQITYEQGRAVSTATVAAQEADTTRAKAQAAAAELMSAAEVDRLQTGADDAAYRAGGRAFVLERWLAGLRTALARAAVEIVDGRLGPPDLATLDLRPPAGAGAVKEMQ